MHSNALKHIRSTNSCQPECSSVEYQRGEGTMEHFWVITNMFGTLNKSGNNLVSIWAQHNDSQHLQSPLGFANKPQK